MRKTTLQTEDDSGRVSDDEEADPPTSPRAAKRRKTNTLDLSDVPMNLPPIPSDRPGSASRFKGVRKSRKKWVAQIEIPSEGGKVYLGTFDSEEEAGIMHARARYKYPVGQSVSMPSSTMASRHRSSDFSSPPMVYDIQRQARSRPQQEQ